MVKYSENCLNSCQPIAVECTLMTCVVSSQWSIIYHRIQRFQESSEHLISIHYSFYSLKHTSENYKIHFIIFSDDHFKWQWYISQVINFILLNLLKKTKKLPIGTAVTREQSPAFLRNSNGRLDLPGPTQEASWIPRRNSRIPP